MNAEFATVTIQERVKWRASKDGVSHGCGYVWATVALPPVEEVDEVIRSLVRAGILINGSDFVLDGDGWTSSGKIEKQHIRRIRDEQSED